MAWPHSISEVTLIKSQAPNPKLQISNPKSQVASARVRISPNGHVDAEARRLPGLHRRGAEFRGGGGELLQDGRHPGDAPRRRRGDAVPGDQRLPAAEDTPRMIRTAA